MALESLERRDCPAAVGVSTSTASVAEAGGSATFTVSLSQRDTRAVTVGYLLGGTATLSSDYRLTLGTTPLAPSGTLTFAPGELTKVIRMTTVNDIVRERTITVVNNAFNYDPNEFVTFNLLPPRNATLDPLRRNATTTIVDDDDYVATIVADTNAARQAMPGQSARFTLTLDKPATQMEQFFVSTGDGSAMAGRDYGPLSRAPLVISPGQKTKDFWVTVPQTTTGGTFFVAAEAASPGFPAVVPVGATITGPAITPPATPSLIVSDSLVYEGNTGTRQAVFTVMLTAAAATPITVDYATADGSAKLANNDYQQVPTSTLTFAPGVTVQTVAVAIVGDTTLEPDETYSLVLSNPAGAAIARTTGLGTIRNDEAGFVPQPVPWTILVYMTGDNLNEYAFQDINEMETALTKLSGTRIVVSWDQPPAADARAYPTGGGAQAAWRTYGRSVLKADTNTNSIASTFDLSFGERNTGNPATLVDFVKWATTKAPAERYLLQMWGHGGGLDGSQFDSESGDDALDINEIRQALSAPGMPTIDVLSYDNCLMGMAEVGYAISTSVTGQFVASEELVNGTGQDYTTAYQALAVNNPRAVTPAMLAAGMVTSFGTQYKDDQFQCDTYSSVATTGYAGLTAALQQFVAAAANLTANDRGVLQAAANAAPNYENLAPTSFVDLGRFMALAGANVPVLRPAAAAVNGALNAMVTSKTGDQRNSSGISIYVPTGPDDRYLDSYSRTAAAFCTATNWNLFATWMAGGTARAARAAGAATTGPRTESRLWDHAGAWAAYGASQSAAAGDDSGSKTRARIAIVPRQAARA